ncbi:hypothetical protein ACRAWD_22620 [Caulobacter segnis]
MSVQGTISSTSTATNIAIQDSGFFVVTADPSGRRRRTCTPATAVSRKMLTAI